MSTKWEERFMSLAAFVATWSKDPDHQVGAVITTKDNRVLSLGYNGPPRGTNDSELTNSAKVFRTLHAELNAILNARHDLEGSTIYVYPFNPCAQCAAAIIQKGITKVVCRENSRMLTTWESSQNEAASMFEEAGVKVVLIKR